MAGILFLCCDMGETNALIPIMHELHATKKENFKIIAMGAAINKLESDPLLKNYVTKLEETVDTANDRSKPIHGAAEAVKGLTPRLVISGAASQAQKQLLEALEATQAQKQIVKALRTLEAQKLFIEVLGASQEQKQIIEELSKKTIVKSVVYLDNFNYATTNSSFDTVKEVSSVAQKIICVSDIVKEQISSCVKLKEKSIKPFGRPSLESWVNQVKEVKSQGYVTFIGGYGDRYKNGVNDAYDKAKATLEKAGYHVHIQHHPNVMKEQPLTTIEAVGRANFVVCYDSTVGFESLFAGKNVIYLQPENVEPYDNIALEKGLAIRVKNDEELLTALKEASAEKKDPYEVLGVVKNSTELIIEYILK